MVREEELIPMRERQEKNLLASVPSVVGVGHSHRVF